MRTWIGRNYMETLPDGINRHVGRVAEQDDSTWVWMVYASGPLVARRGVGPSEEAARAAVVAEQNAYQGYGERDPIVSVHEAAHAVLAHLTGFLVFTSDLVADTTAPGVETARHKLLVKRSRDRLVLSDGDLDRMHAGVFAAGYVAELRFLAESGADHDPFLTFTGAHGDRQVLKVSEMGSWEGAKAEAERVLTPPVWDGVMKVAHVLDNRTPPVITCVELVQGIIPWITGL